jgi:hypothetical protein
VLITYLDELVAALGDRLVAAYLAGSRALGEAAPASDVDVLAVVRGPFSPDPVVAAVRHESLPVPARRLELVVYTDDAVRTPTPGGAFALNLNTGPGMPLHVSTDPDEEPPFWFVLDRALVRAHGVPLGGPPADEVIAPLPHAWVEEAFAGLLQWYRAHQLDENAVLAACRALLYAAEGRFATKGEAGAWMQHPLADRALARRRGEPVELDPAEVDAFVAAALDGLRDGS